MPPTLLGKAVGPTSRRKWAGYAFAFGNSGKGKGYRYTLEDNLMVVKTTRLQMESG